MWVLAGCGGTQPLPDIDATVEARVAEERAKAAEATVEAIVEATVQAVLTADNVVLFPDAGLDAAIREALGKAVQDKITTKELAKLVELDCSICGILDLTGLEYATTLTRLALDNNQITDVNALAGLKQLELNNLRGNPGLTKAEAEKLQKALPKCEIQHNATK